MEELVARRREQRRGPSSRSPPRRLLLEPASDGEAGMSSQRRHPCFSSLLPPPLFHARSLSLELAVEEEVAPQIRHARLILELGGLELALEEEVAASCLGRSPAPPASSFSPTSRMRGWPCGFFDLCLDFDSNGGFVNGIGDFFASNRGFVPLSLWLLLLSSLFRFSLLWSSSSSSHGPLLLELLHGRTEEPCGRAARRRRLARRAARRSRPARGVGRLGLRAAEAVGPRHVGRWRTAATALDLAPGKGCGKIAVALAPPTAAKESLN
nr:unnamed protein product [Digitaria exilis]